MDQMPHKCGPATMGVGWKEELSSVVRRRPFGEKVPFVKQTTFEETSQLDDGKSGDIVVGNLTFNLKQCRATQKGVIETEEPKILTKCKTNAKTSLSKLSKIDVLLHFFK